MNTAEASYRSPTYHELAAPPELDWRPFRPESYFAYRREWERRGAEGDQGGFPLHLDLDPTNRCNLSCVMCPRTVYLSRGRSEWAPGGFGDMDFGFYREIIEGSVPLGLKSVKLNFLGEPLLHPRICEMVALAREAGLWVMINTNAVLLDASMSRRLLEAGITDLFFSFDSPYPEEYNKIRRGADYRRVLENIRGFMETLERSGIRGTQTRASMVLPEDPLNRDRIKADYLRLFRDLGVAEIGFGLPTVVDRDYEALGRNPGFRCPDLFRRAFVFHDGVVGPCCGDWERRLVMGDARKSSLEEIWNSEAYRNLREPHLRQAYGEVPVCRSCSVPYLSMIEA
ncbi:MAG: radical SAM protein [Deltaproteobacteria bacterium]|jgi:MoaA/NifB/PqqE/SkfB family radical SAM enzyme|nr:radical SAM protein [Deltaproteobacteria bacterium]